MTDHAAVGKKVLAGLAKGRQNAIKQAKEGAEPNEREIRRALDRDILAGNPARGRAGRIARAVRGRVSVKFRKEVRTYISRQGVEKILQRLLSRCASTGFNDGRDST
jgi:hypothetical protein